MKLKLMDYMDRTKEFDIGDIDDILRIDIRILSGDEIAIVTYMNGDKEKFDSCNTRTMDFYDGEYCLYSRYEGNMFEEFLKRKSSYDINLWMKNMDTTNEPYINVNELKTYWEKYDADYVTKYRCPLCHTDAAYQIVDEDGRLRHRLENFCPHCGQRLYNPNLSTEK